MKRYKHMDLEALRLLMFLAEGGGLSYASFKLGIPLSSASYKLRRFEAALGVSLFTKEGRHLALKRNTQHFVQLARDLLASNDRFFRPDETLIRVGLSDGFLGIMEIDEILQVMGIDQKKADVRVVIRTDAMIADQVAENRFDMALFWSLSDQSEPSEPYCLLEKPMQWVGKRTSARGETQTIFASPPCLFRHAAQTALGTLDAPPLQVDICAQSVQQALSLVRDLGGVTIATDLHRLREFSWLECLDAGRPGLPSAHLNFFQRQPDRGARHRLRERLMVGEA